jgi:tetratricopeptide (TPR) repeat protein
VDILNQWSDRRTGGGEDWYQEIQEAMAKANVAILLVSRHFLTSNFIIEEEVPRLIERREKEGVRIFPIIAEPCAWKQVKWLSSMNLRPKDGKPLSGGNEHQIDTDLAAIAEEIATIIKGGSNDSSDKSPKQLNPDKISLAKLPSTSYNLFGREKELETLDTAWDDSKTNIVTLVAWGGEGKTALINSWLNRMRDKHFGGAECVYGWSFYSKGASQGTQLSAELFIASTLEWFGDPEPNKGSPWDKGERLAEFIKKQKTLLILDGLEPLQNPPEEGEGQIMDPGLKSLVRELAHQNPGLCVITSRLKMDDLKDFIGNSVQSIPLEHLSPDSGKELLEHLGVKGEPEELKKACREFGCHALALTLLGSYLNVVYDGDVRKRYEIARLTDDEENGGHAKRVMESYEKWFKGKPELNILQIIGLFDRPVDSGAIEALKVKPVIKSLTSDFRKLSYKNWQFALNRLRKVGLLAIENSLESDKLDCHPLIREYFGVKLKENNPDAWKEAHSRLYEYYKSHAIQYPNTIEEMAPLYAAVAHGCLAGRHQEAMDEVYWVRINREEEHFNIVKLGVTGSNLATLSRFFEVQWNKPVTNLTDEAKGFILSEVGHHLQELGRLADAVQPIQASLEAAIIQENWSNAAIAAGNLSTLNLIMGNITSALNYAREAMDMASRNGITIHLKNSRIIMATALHQAGQLSEAEAFFAEAEEMQKKSTPEYSFLYGVSGFLYCDLLLDQVKYLEALSRAEQSLELSKQFDYPLDISLSHLSIGCVHLLQNQQDGNHDFTAIETHLNQSVKGVRRLGTQFELPGCLLARAELYRLCYEFKEAQHDLGEALVIAERGDMGLHKADCNLEYARLYLVRGRKADARTNLDTAKEMIGRMEYHRRDIDVSEIEEKLT